MNAVILDVRDPETAFAEFAAAWHAGEARGETRLSFATPKLLWKALTAKRWEILKALCGAGEVSIREAARRVARDVKAVHGDVKALLAAGLLDRGEQGGIVLPYDAVNVVLATGSQPNYTTLMHS